MTNYVEIEEFVGKTFVSVTNKDDYTIIFKCEDGTSYKMFHFQDCCEEVYVEDICGDLDDLVGTKILLAEEVSRDDPNASESGTWTLYKFGTFKGSVTIRWYGRSNGCYSERVSICKHL